MKKITIIMFLTIITFLCIAFNSNSEVYASIPATASLDVNNDGKIDIKDLAIISSNYNVKKSGNKYQAKYDLNSDGIIDLYDMTSVSKKIGTIIPSNIKVESVALNKTTDTLVVGEYVSLSATIYPSNASNQRLMWESSNPKVATIPNGGVVATAVGPGTATITATTVDGSKTASCTITVLSPSIKLNKTNDTITVGKYDVLSANVSPNDTLKQAVAWKSSNPNVATVSGVKTYNTSGKAIYLAQVTGVTAGKTSITATTADGNKTAVCNVTINNPASIKAGSVTLNKTNDAITVGYTDNLTATVSPDNAANKTVTWKSSNPKVAAVSSTGKITAISAGTAAITATANDGSNKTATCTILVNNNAIVTFKDENLEQVIRDTLKKPTGNIYKSDVQTIKVLNADGKFIKDISGIRNLSNLTELYLGYALVYPSASSTTSYITFSNSISNTDELKELKNLQYLNLNGNNITNVDALKNLSNLQYLDLGSNYKLNSIDPLKNLSNLQYLNLAEDSKLTDIYKLKEINNLRILSLSYGNSALNDINSLVNSLKGLNKLHELDIIYSRDISTISESDKQAIRSVLPSLIEMQFTGRWIN
ncbi:MAG: Ig-like domain-containing protein [Clostridium sp.]|uniref:Ig-like domain-containing protein n=1 Tax=Clostridium sp. TaxID=1506 RepID=UPI0039E754AD